MFKREKNLFITRFKRDQLSLIVRYRSVLIHFSKSLESLFVKLVRYFSSSQKIESDVSVLLSLRN